MRKVFVSGVVLGAVATAVIVGQVNARADARVANRVVTVNASLAVIERACFRRVSLRDGGEQLWAEPQLIVTETSSLLDGGSETVEKYLPTVDVQLLNGDADAGFRLFNGPLLRGARIKASLED